MKIAISKRINSHRKRIQAFIDYLRRRGHSCKLCINRMPRQCDVVFIFNGLHPAEQRAAEIFRKRGTKVFYIEVGCLPQTDHYLVGKTPQVAGGMLEGEDVPPLTNEDDRYLQAFFGKYSNGANMNEERTQVSGFLQLENDYAIKCYSKFRSMQEVIDTAKERYPDEKIVWKVHPKKRRINLKADHTFYRGPSLWPHVARAKFCIAANSTTLIESALAGRPIVALGETPLNRAEGPRAVVREIIRRQISIYDNDDTVTQKIERSIGESL